MRKSIEFIAAVATIVGVSIGIYQFSNGNQVKVDNLYSGERDSIWAYSVEDKECRNVKNIFNKLANNFVTGEVELGDQIIEIASTGNILKFAELLGCGTKILNLGLEFEDVYVLSNCQNYGPGSGQFAVSNSLKTCSELAFREGAR